MSELLKLKWGTLKAWRIGTERSEAAIEKYFALGTAMGAAQQHDTPAHKEALCELIDAIDGEIVNDWSGEPMTKFEAKKYVMEYGR